MTQAIDRRLYQRTAGHPPAGSQIPLHAGYTEPRETGKTARFLAYIADLETVKRLLK